MQSTTRLYLVLWLLIAVLSVPTLIVGTEHVIEARKRARRPQCVNSIKQFVLAINQVQRAAPRQSIWSRLSSVTASGDLQPTRDNASYARSSHR
jgi:hypothetical protein